MATATGGPLNTAKRQLSAFLCLTRGMSELPSLLLARQHTNALLPLLKAQLDKLSGRWTEALLILYAMLLTAGNGKGDTWWRRRI